jgi:hypothetical protein
MKRTHQSTTYHLEIFPASLLSKRQGWQSLTEHVPPQTFVLIARLEDPAQMQFMYGLGRSLRKMGRAVYIVSVG